MQKSERAPAATAAIKTVEALAQFDRPAGLSDISVATGLNKNMISRILSSLLDAGWVTLHKETGRYSLSLRLFQLSSMALGKKDLMRCADPYLRRLNDLTGECIQMAVLSEDRAVYIAQMASRKFAGIHGRLGASYSLDNTAPGKVLKAFVKGDAALEKVRVQGYAIDNEEYGRGVICLAAPVFDYTGKAVAAIGIASLTIIQSLPEMIDNYLDILLAQTAGLSWELGYIGSENQL